MEIQEAKVFFRKGLKKRLSHNEDLPSLRREGALSKVSLKLFFEAASLEKIDFVGLYKPLKDEPHCTVPKGLCMAWPKITDEKRGQMSFFRSKVFEKNKTYGMEEPVFQEGGELSKERLSVIFVPGLAFDTRGVRLGRGKGFYDRYLKDFKGVKVGVCQKSRFLNEPIPFDPEWDVKMDWVVTDDFVYQVRP